MLHFGLWLTAAPPLLSEPNQSNGQFGFTLTGDANVPYIIEGSSNLAIWRPLTTNLDPASVRSISVNATSQWNFYRVHQAQPLFAFALACKESLDLNVNSLASDSFDSSDPLLSTNGKYDPTNAQAGGDIAAYWGLTNSLPVGDASIFGHLSTGPNPILQIGTNGAVGDLDWHNGGNIGIEPGWASEDLKVDFPDVVPPFTVGFAPSAGTVGGVSYNYVLGTGNYVINSGNLSGTVIVTGIANLCVGPRAGIRLSGGSDTIIIQTNASLNLYANATNAFIGRQGVQNAGYATQFIYWG